MLCVLPGICITFLVYENMENYSGDIIIIKEKKKFHLSVPCFPNDTLPLNATSAANTWKRNEMTHRRLPQNFFKKGTVFGRPFGVFFGQ